MVDSRTGRLYANGLPKPATRGPMLKVDPGKDERGSETERSKPAGTLALLPELSDWLLQIKRLHPSPAAGYNWPPHQKHTPGLNRMKVSLKSLCTERKAD